MDPLTAALNLTTKIVEFMEMTFKALPPEEQAAMAKIHLSNAKWWQDLIEKVRPQI